MPSCDFNNFANCTCSDCAMRGESDPDHCLICGVEFSEELMKKRINSYVYYCEECQIIKENKKKEREEKQKEEEELKRNDFLNKQNELFQQFYTTIDKNNVELLPIKIIDSYRNYIYDSYINELGVNKKFMSMKLIDVQKIKGKWYINKNKVELFYNLNMQNYYIIYDPRVHRYHIRI